jgi:rubrerythrin
MPSTMTIEEILEFAIGQERAAAELYTRLAGESRGDAGRKMFLECAEEERGHERKLLAVKGGARALDPKGKVADLSIAEYAKSPVALDGVADYQTILLFVMHQEKQAFRLYTELATLADDEAGRQLLLGLAQEEAKHKLRFELEYDNNILKEN